ncbi:hypothetical protein ACQ1Q5_00135 [Ornithobacterium rhinotracheale]
MSKEVIQEILNSEICQSLLKDIAKFMKENKLSFTPQNVDVAFKAVLVANFKFYDKLESLPATDQIHLLLNAKEMSADEISKYFNEDKQ